MISFSLSVISNASFSSIAFLLISLLPIVRLLYLLVGYQKLQDLGLVFLYSLHLLSVLTANFFFTIIFALLLYVTDDWVNQWLYFSEIIFESLLSIIEKGGKKIKWDTHHYSNAIIPWPLTFQIFCLQISSISVKLKEEIRTLNWNSCYYQQTMYLGAISTITSRLFVSFLSTNLSLSSRRLQSMLKREKKKWVN